MLDTSALNCILPNIVEVFHTGLGSNPADNTTGSLMVGSLLNPPELQFPHLQNSNNYPISGEYDDSMRHQWKILAHRRYSKHAGFLPDLDYKWDDTRKHNLNFSH